MNIKYLKCHKSKKLSTRKSSKIIKASTTFKAKAKKAGLEPDDCFYIQNNVAMRGIRKLNMAIDPPPDLAIKVDVTSKTKFDVYRVLGVPELWLSKQRADRLE